MIAGCGESGSDILDDARHATQSAPFLIAGGSRSFTASSKNLTVLVSRGRVRSWTTAKEDLTWQPVQRCYERTTVFNHADTVDIRRGVVPQDLQGVLAHSRDDGRIVFAHGAGDSDRPGNEYAFALDASGRLRWSAQRSPRFGAIAPGRWSSTRYRYPTRIGFTRAVGSRPAPIC